MRPSRHEIKAELTDKTEIISKKLYSIFGDYARDIDFSGIRLFTCLFYNELRHDPRNPGWVGRDRLVISNPKLIPSLLAVLAQAGYINWKECHDVIIQLPKFFSGSNIALVNYPGVEFMTQIPYQGMLFSLGAALVGKRSRKEYRVYHVTDDKRSTQLQDALISASGMKLENLTTIIPDIDMQKRSSIIHFWFSMGWQLEEIHFDDVSSIYEGFYRAARAKEKPKIILG
ncbi:MAG: hypothetical protein K8T10_12560 [Candidatus Eremiobacteraeota bacterium]|nr:hypothetical protein [Candidatus Eremiobacteraeota bacterium]